MFLVIFYDLFAQIINMYVSNFNNQWRSQSIMNLFARVGHEARTARLRPQCLCCPEPSFVDAELQADSC